MEIKKLKDLCIGKGEYGIAAPAEPFSESKYRYLRITDISDNGTLLSDDPKSVSCPGCEKCILQENDIVFARTGNSTGRAFFYEPKYGELVYAGFLIKFHLDDTKVTPKYMKYYTISQTYRNWVNNGPTGSTRGNMSEGDFADMPVFLPSRKQQDAIVNLFSPFDEKIDNNNAIAAELEGMAKDLYDYWFVQFDFPDENGKPYKSSGGKMVWNEELKREIPEGWEATNIGAITICHDSERIPVSGEKRKMMIGSIPYYGATEIMGHVNRAIFNGDYVLLAEDGSVMDDSGHPIIQRISGPSWVNNHAHVLEPEKTYSCRLLMMILKDIPVVQIKTGSIQWKINQENLNKYKIANIPSALRALAVSKLEPIDSMLLDLKKENEELTSLRDFLLPMLLNGQVKVKGA